MAILEELEHLTWVGVATGFVLRIQHFAINLDVEDAFRSHHKGQVFYDMLVVGHEIIGSAHGAL